MAYLISYNISLHSLLTQVLFSMNMSIKIITYVLSNVI